MVAMRTKDSASEDRTRRRERDQLPKCPFPWKALSVELLDERCSCLFVYSEMTFPSPSGLNVT